MGTSEVNFFELVTDSTPSGRVTDGDVTVNFDGSTVAVASSAHQSTIVYTLDGDNYVEQKKLVVPGGQSDIAFGRSIGLDNSGNTLVVGAEGFVSNDIAAGAAVVFSRVNNEWDAGDMVLPVDSPQDKDLFGYAVDISDDGSYLIIGAPNAEAPGTQNNSGIAHVFTKEGGWNVGSKPLNQAVNQSESNYGSLVDIDGLGQAGYVGASGTKLISLFIRSSDNWDMTFNFRIGNDGQAFELTTGHMSKNHKVMFLGAPNVHGTGTSGAVFGLQFLENFKYDSSTKIVPLQGSGTVGDRFGTSLSLSHDGTMLAVGAPGEHAVYLYTSSDFQKWAFILKVENVGQPGFGEFIQLSGDGSTLVVSTTSAANVAIVYRFNFDSGTGGFWSFLFVVLGILLLGYFVLFGYRKYKAKTSISRNMFDEYDPAADDDRYNPLGNVNRNSTGGAQPEMTEIELRRQNEGLAQV